MTDNLSEAKQKRLAEVEAKVKKMRNRMNSGIDPEMLAAAMEITSLHIESGARTFAQYAKLMISRMGAWIKPHLLGWWKNAKYGVGIDKTAQKEMDDPTEEQAQAILDIFEDEEVNSDEEEGVTDNESDTSDDVERDSEDSADEDPTRNGTPKPDGTGDRGNIGDTGNGNGEIEDSEQGDGSIPDGTTPVPGKPGNIKIRGGKVRSESKDGTTRSSESEGSESSDGEGIEVDSERIDDAYEDAPDEERSDEVGTDDTEDMEDRSTAPTLPERLIQQKKAEKFAFKLNDPANKHCDDSSVSLPSDQ